jgi:DNA-binding response OmpR family regulator
VKVTDQVVFPPFRLDLGNEQLWHDNQLVPLRPKAFAVLRYLVEQAGRLVMKEDLLKAVWLGTRVNDTYGKDDTFRITQPAQRSAQAVIRRLPLVYRGL